MTQIGERLVFNPQNSTISDKIPCTTHDIQHNASISSLLYSTCTRWRQYYHHLMSQNCVSVQLMIYKRYKGGGVASYRVVVCVWMCVSMVCNFDFIQNFYLFRFTTTSYALERFSPDRIDKRLHIHTHTHTGHTHTAGRNNKQT